MGAQKVGRTCAKAPSGAEPASHVPRSGEPVRHRSIFLFTQSSVLFTQS